MKNIIVAIVLAAGFVVGAAAAAEAHPDSCLVSVHVGPVHQHHGC